MPAWSVPGQPEHGLAAHPLEADQHVLQRVVQRMPDVQRAGDVRRRDHDRERLGPHSVSPGITNVVEKMKRPGFHRGVL
jgi:hypothetical protein